MKVKVYVQTDCVQCKMTMNLLRQMQVPFETVNLNDYPEERSRLKELGYQATPVVITDKERWAGFCPDKIKELSEQ